MRAHTWDDFVKYLETVYSPSFAPEYLAVACPVPGVPEDLWFAAKIVFPDPEAWLHNPIPQLDGVSAADAIGRGQADTVREIITQVSSFFLPSPDELRPWEAPPEGSDFG